MKLVLLSILIVLFHINSAFSVKWEDCGIPLTRKISYLSTVVSPDSIAADSKNSDRTINVNVKADLQNYVVTSNVKARLLVTKDSETYVDVLVGDLCSIIQKYSQKSCPLTEKEQTFTFQYVLPPLPTGTYIVKVITYEEDSGKEVGCLQVNTTVTGLGGSESCTYTSTIDAELFGQAEEGESGNSIQIGPWGPNGIDLTYAWGTFNYLDATDDLIGALGVSNLNNYVWGITGYINKTVSGNLFQGTFVVGYRPDANDNANAQLVHQGFFSWLMTEQDIKPRYLFQSGKFIISPAYYYPSGFPYPLNIGNLGELTATRSGTGNSIVVSGKYEWCRCNCDDSESAVDGKVASGSGKNDDGLSGFTVGTIVIAVVGGAFLIIAVVFLLLVLRRPRKPVIYDDNDVMDPQKPDYGTIAINEVFDADERDY